MSAGAKRRDANDKTLPESGEGSAGHYDYARIARIVMPPRPCRLSGRFCRLHRDASRQPDVQRRESEKMSAMSSHVNRLLVAKGLRAFGDGYVSLLLPLYLLELGFSPLQVGIIATTTLVGSGLLTLAVGLHAWRYHYRSLLLAASVLMALTGFGFAVLHRFLAAAAGRAGGNAESLERGCQRVPAAGACRARARGERPAAHGDVCALQPRRLPARRRGIARGGAARDASPA